MLALGPRTSPLDLSAQGGWDRPLMHRRTSTPPSRHGLQSSLVMDWLPCWLISSGLATAPVLCPLAAAIRPPGNRISRRTMEVTKGSSVGSYCLRPGPISLFVCFLFALTSADPKALPSDHEEDHPQTNATTRHMHAALSCWLISSGYAYQLVLLLHCSPTAYHSPLGPHTFTDNMHEFSA